MEVDNKKMLIDSVAKAKAKAKVPRKYMGGLMCARSINIEDFVKIFAKERVTTILEEKK